jgi:protein TonB
VFSRLPESNAPRQRRTGGLVLSTAAHVVVIALAVRATMLTATPAPKVAPLPPLLAPLVRPHTPRTNEPPRGSATGDSRMPTPPQVPAPPAIPSFDSPTIPDPGPAVDITRDFGTPSLVSLWDSGGTPNAGDGPPLEERFVDKVVVALPGTATPRYPSMLQSAGVEGDVRAQFVVDTLGRVEQGSVRVLAATHDLFAAAVGDALGRARFKPAEAGGHKVRQLAEQTFTFRLGVR